MRSLAELQQAFGQHLLSPDRAPDDALLRAIKVSGLPPVGQLGVYQNNVLARIIDALAGTYPAVERLVGREFFRYAARTYAASHPPRSPLLSEYGDAFPDFLRTFAPAASVPYLADVALLEKLYLQAYHAPERAPLAQEVVAARLAEAHAHRLMLHPSAHLMRSPFPVSCIWEANRGDAAIEKLQIPGGAEHLLIIRPGPVVEVRRVHPAAHAMLAVLCERGSVADAYAAGGRGALPPEQLCNMLDVLAAGGTFCSMERI